MKVVSLVLSLCVCALWQHIPVEADREEVRDWVLSVCMDAKIDQALPPEKNASGTLYQVFLWGRGVPCWHEGEGGAKVEGS